MKSRRPRPKGTGDPVLVRLQPELAARLDEWRRKQADLPSRAEAVRRLVELPAFIYAFDAQFSTFEEVQTGPQEVFPMFLFEDVVPPGGAGPHPQKTKQIEIAVPNADVVYGGFWYEDWQKRVHIFRFILRIAPGMSWYGSTLTSVPGVDPTCTEIDAASLTNAR